MKKYFIIASFAALSLFAGCTKEVVESPQDGDRLTFTVENSDTKTVGYTSLRFNSGDKLSVFDSFLANNVFSQVKSGSATSMSYTGTITSSSSADYVVYPYADSSTVAADGTIAVTIPSQWDAKNNNSVLGGMNLSVGVLDGGNCTLKNVFGIVGVSIPTTLFGIRNVKLSANESFVGKVSFKYNGGNPVVTGVENGKNSVEFNVKLNTSTGRPDDGRYYFCVVPGTYTGIKLTVTLYNGRTVEFTSSNPLTVTRNSRTMLKEFALDEIQTAPSDSLTLSLDFTTNTPLYRVVGDKTTNLPAGSSYASGSYYFDKGEYSYPFFVGGAKLTVGGKTYDPKFYWHGTNKALMLVTGACYIITPPIPGKKLVKYRFSNANTLSSSATKKLVIYNKPGELADSLAAKYPGNVASSTHAANEITFSEWVAVNGSVAGPMFIYPVTSTSNVCIRCLELTYADVE